MIMDWQTIVVALAVAAALLYVARRGLARLRSFVTNGGGEASCATGCGKCGDEPKPTRQAAPVIVQIKRPGDSPK